jgi:ABC-type uncharacterized transport system ATPase subunit
MDRPALELLGIEKRFGATVALAGAALSVRAGTMHMLLGENGAGKTTLLRVAAGFTTPDSGTVSVGGARTHWRSRAEAFRSGVAAVEQHFSLVAAMTVSENIALAAPSLFSGYSVRTAAARVREIADSIGLSVDPGAIVGNLPVAGQQRAEILKALSTNASLLILDEPTAVLSPKEADDLFAWLRRFVDAGRAAVIITHRIREALEYGDALTVLRAGRTVLATDRGAVTKDALVAAILGDSVTPEVHASVPLVQRVSEREELAVLQSVWVRDHAGVDRLREVSLSVRAGQLIGVAGVEGSGQHELMRVVAGRLAPTRGTVRLPRDPSFVPEDRLRDAIVPEFTLVENFALRDAGGRAGLMPWAELEAVAQEKIEEFSVRPSDPRRPAGTLSGGNQQRFVLAREFSASPTLIVAENPARGLDVRAAAEVFQRLKAARDAGAAVIIYSSDIDELLAIADRMLVCFSGSVRETAVTFEAVGAAMLGSP